MPEPWDTQLQALGAFIRSQRKLANLSLRQLADMTSLSNPYLSQIERGVRRPSAEILQQIAKGLRISAEALYVQAGILEDRPADSGVRAAVLAEPELTERQKQVLLEIYDSFRKEAAALREQAAAGEPAAGTGAAVDAAAWATVAGEPAAGDPAAASAAMMPPGPEDEVDDPLAAPGLLTTEEEPGAHAPASGTSGLPPAGQEG